MATILVVDDDRNNRLLIQTVLRHAGHEVLEAADSDSALHLAETKHPDLLLTDLNLLGNSGTELIKRLRNDRRTANMRIALYTGTDENPMLRDFMELHGIKHVIPKPAEPETILRVVGEALGTIEP